MDKRKMLHERYVLIFVHRDWLILIAAGCYDQINFVQSFALLSSLLYSVEIGCLHVHLGNNLHVSWHPAGNAQYSAVTDGIVPHMADYHGWKRQQHIC